MSAAVTERTARVAGLVALLALGVAAALPAGGTDAAPATLGALADDAATTLTTRFYAGTGRWRTCLGPSCGAGNVDWGSDSLTGVLYLRWRTTHDAALVRIARELEATEPRYGTCRAPRCTAWSDVPAWDAVAAIRTYDMTGDAAALRNAEAAYAFVADSDVFARGACPEIAYQRPHAASGGLKTLETEANLALAAALLAQRASSPRYRADAQRDYAAIRARFFDAETQLYTVYVFDDGRTCVALPHRFFASVNGVMIEAGLILARVTGEQRYAADARATAHAVHALDDARGIFADLQAENDIVEPLVLAMDELARSGDRFALDWIVRNAAAAAHARRDDGAYGRFFDGPPPLGTVTQWQVNGALALEVVAGALAPSATPEPDDPWRAATTAPLAATTLPATIPFTGSGVALIGTLGERCCELGRARVLIDGVETFDRTGIWQNKSSAGRALPGTVLFAWRWPASGRHEIRLEPDAANAKEGGPFADVGSISVEP
ncbi:MAG TPA: hypothetical protein VHT53_11355 [Candidatus Elarobacter sp.]|nr:hypothetical protein [Candidatus Elarobacter sp.]